MKLMPQRGHILSLRHDLRRATALAPPTTSAIKYAPLVTSLLMLLIPLGYLATLSTRHVGTLNGVAITGGGGTASHSVFDPDTLAAERQLTNQRVGNHRGNDTEAQPQTVQKPQQQRDVQPGYDHNPLVDEVRANGTRINVTAGP